MKKKGRAVISWIYAGSAAFHLALAAVAYSLPKEHKVASVTIELADIKKKNEKPKPPVVPPPPPPPPTDKPKPPPPPAKEAKAKLAAEAPKDAPAPEALDSEGFADLGSVALGNGGSGGGGGDGVAIAATARATGPAGAAPRAAPTATTRKVEALQQTASEACNEPDVKPKHLTQALPKLTHAAQVAEIEGVVRVEVTVDESGKVISARVVGGLGYGLDEEALKAAKSWTFHPAMRCGKPIIGHTTIPFRFSLT